MKIVWHLLCINLGLHMYLYLVENELDIKNSMVLNITLEK